MKALLQPGFDMFSARADRRHPKSHFLTLFFVLVSAILLHCLPAAARLDETPAQCQQRYGNPVRAIPGSNGVAMAYFYNKQGMEIIAVFVGRSTNDAHVGLIFYSRIGKNIPGLRIGPPTPEEESALLATVPGRWENYALPPTIQSAVKDKSITPVTSVLEKRRAECWSIVQSFGKSEYSMSSWPTLADIGHMGNTRFAFRIPAGVAFAFYDAIPAIQKWHNEIQRQNANAKRPPPTNLSGF
jgi:hypothetical protein